MRTLKFVLIDRVQCGIFLVARRLIGATLQPMVETAALVGMGMCCVRGGNLDLHVPVEWSVNFKD